MLALAVGVNCLSLWFKKEQMGFSGLQCFVVLWGSFFLSWCEPDPRETCGCCLCDNLKFVSRNSVLVLWLFAAQHSGSCTRHHASNRLPENSALLPSLPGDQPEVAPAALWGLGCYRAVPRPHSCLLLYAARGYFKAPLDLPVSCGREMVSSKIPT